MIDQLALEWPAGEPLAKRSSSVAQIAGGAFVGGFTLGVFSGIGATLAMQALLALIIVNSWLALSWAQ